MAPDVLPLQDVESVKAMTGSVTCRLLDEQAVLQCKRCGRELEVLTAPRRDFLAAVRGFVAEHEDCGS
ncbi:MAG: hypothetical protein QOJ79_3124 [Actinomycetota bacterium]|nr:hypothetical protein [Actinomycetota bacterium]